MEKQSLAVPNLDTAIEQALIGGDLKALAPAQRVAYYKAVCESLQLNPLTKPFDYIVLNGKLVLYPNADCAEQLRNVKRVSITKLEKQFVDGLYLVTAHAQLPDGRMDEATGAVAIEGMKGAERANVIMKAETKAKRRVTLSICGLSGLELSDDVLARNKTDEEYGNRNGYTPTSEWTEELDEPTTLISHDAPTNENGQVLTMPSIVAPTTVKPEPTASEPTDPLKMLRAFEAQFAAEYARKARTPQEQQWDAQQIVFALKGTALGGAEELRHALKMELFGKRDITPAQRSAMRKWLGTDAAKKYIADFVAAAETKVVAQTQAVEGTFTRADDTRQDVEWDDLGAASEMETVDLAAAAPAPLNIPPLPPKISIPSVEQAAQERQARAHAQAETLKPASTFAANKMTRQQKGLLMEQFMQQAHGDETAALKLLDNAFRARFGNSQFEASAKEADTLLGELTGDTAFEGVKP